MTEIWERVSEMYTWLKKTPQNLKTGQPGGWEKVSAFCFCVVRLSCVILIYRTGLKQNRLKT